MTGKEKTLHIHLGLYGKFRRHKSPPPEPRGAVRLRVVGGEKAFDLNGPTACELLSQPKVNALLNRLGVDPLRDDADPEKAWDRIRRTRSPIGTVLMNQAIIAGVGNVYRSEILFLLRIHPERPANTFSRDEFDGLWKLTVDLLKIGKRYNRIIIADPKDGRQIPQSHEPQRASAGLQERFLHAVRNSHLFVEAGSSQSLCLSCVPAG